MKVRTKLFSLATAFVMTVSTLAGGMPSMLLKTEAVQGSNVIVNDIDVDEGEYLAVDATKPTSKQPSGGYLYYKNGILTMHDYTYTGANNNNQGFIVSLLDCDLNLVLEGTNTFTFVDLESASSCIFAFKDLGIKGDGTLKIKTSGSGLTSGDGQVNVTGGNIDITSGDYGIEADMGVYLSDTSLKIDSESAGIYNTLNGIAIESGDIEIDSLVSSAK